MSSKNGATPETGTTEFNLDSYFIEGDKEAFTNFSLLGLIAKWFPGDFKLTNPNWLGTVMHDGLCRFSAVSKFFDIPADDAELLFSPKGYGDYLPGPSDVAEAIDNYVVVNLLEGVLT